MWLNVSGQLSATGGLPQCCWATGPSDRWDAAAARLDQRGSALPGTFRSH